MKITDSYIENKHQFEEANIKIPSFDDQKIQENTFTHPRWIHFGGGNLYRCFHAKIAQELLNSNDLESGIIVVENFGSNLVNEVYEKNANRSLSVVMKADGTFERELIASTAKACFINRNHTEQLPFLNDAFINKGLQLVTLTITEKGYATKNSAGKVLSVIADDIRSGPKFELLKTTMGQLAYFLYQRFRNGAAPLAVVSTDNFSHNGDRLKEAVQIIVEGWLAEGYVNHDFSNYLFESNLISFPYSMIDRITPGPSKEIAAQLASDGIEGMELLEKSVPPLAAFVNTEEVHYLAIEDHFPNGRPPLEKVQGVFLADRETVNKIDLMKVTTCLNPLHTALAITGSLLGFSSIYDEVQDKDLLGLIEKIGYQEGLPVVENSEIINPNNFIDEVIYKRFMNPNIPDTPQRIATDTSQKLGIRFGETFKSYLKAPNLNVTSLTFIPFTIAAWCRYLMAIDDNGEQFVPSPDPLYTELYEYVKSIKLGDAIDVHQHLGPILQNKEIFGLDLYEMGIGEKIEAIFEQLIEGPQAVRNTLHALLEKEIH